MNKKYFIHAFTISEVVISMVITGLIILLVYEIFSFTNQQFGDHLKAQEQTMNFEQFSMVFNRDVYKSVRAYSESSNTLTLVSPSDTTVYAFAEAYTLRKGDQVDTFAIKVAGFNFKQTIDKKNIGIILSTSLLGSEWKIYEELTTSVSSEINATF